MPNASKVATLQPLPLRECAIAVSATVCCPLPGPGRRKPDVPRRVFVRSEGRA